MVYCMFASPCGIAVRPFVEKIDSGTSTQIIRVAVYLYTKLARGENVPGIPGACATRNFAYLVRGPWVEYSISNAGRHASESNEC